MFRIMSKEDAIRQIPDGAVIAVNSFLALSNPETLHRAVYERFAATGSPRNLTILCAAGFGGWDAAKFAEPYVAAGAVRRVIAGHYASMPVTTRMALNGAIEAYNLPLGVMSHTIRAMAGGHKGYLSKVGLGIYVDPRKEGPGLNDISKEELVRVMEVDGEEYLHYTLPKPDVAFLKGTTVDANGNISFEGEFVTVDALSLAQLTKANGGKVIVQVGRVSHFFSRPRSIVVPGILVDAVVVDEREEMLAVDQTLSGDIHVPPAHMDYWMARLSKDNPKKRPVGDASPGIIGSRGAKELAAGNVVNIGIGLPEMVADYASKMGILKDITLTVEAGGVGGLPAPGVAFGATIGADMICDMAPQFDFYDGGGLDICFMGGLEVDEKGNVNAHRLPNGYTGIGGFANITAGTKAVVFCLTFNAKGLKTALKPDGSVEIVSEGTLPKFKKKIGSISFSAEQALKSGRRVLYVTERCVFELCEEGLRLKEVYPGIDVQRDILDRMEFAPAMG